MGIIVKFKDRLDVPEAKLHIQQHFGVGLKPLFPNVEDPELELIFSIPIPASRIADVARLPMLRKLDYLEAAPIRTTQQESMSPEEF